MRRFVFVLLFVGFSSAYAEKVYEFSKEEKALVTIYKKISRFASEEENLKNNAAFIRLLDSILHVPTSFFYSFDSLQMGNVYAPDKTFRIISWSMIHDNGTYENFGFVQVNPEGKKKFQVVRLYDFASKIKSPHLKVLAPDKWYGASYYQITQVKKKGKTLYTLLGWSPHTLYSQQKIIDVMFFKKGKIYFGAPILEVKGRGSQRRIIYTYSAKNSMMLRYEKKKKMIVFDHLSPSAIRYTGVYEFYGPDFSVDGYKFKKGKWRYYNDIDVRNPRTSFYQYLPFEYIKNLFSRNRQRIQ